MDKTSLKYAYAPLVRTLHILIIKKEKFLWLTILINSSRSNAADGIAFLARHSAGTTTAGTIDGMTAEMTDEMDVGTGATVMITGLGDNDIR